MPKTKHFFALEKTVHLTLCKHNLMIRSHYFFVLNEKAPPAFFPVLGTQICCLSVNAILLGSLVTLSRKSLNRICHWHSSKKGTGIFNFVQQVPFTIILFCSLSLLILKWFKKINGFRCSMKKSFILVVLS